MFKYYFILLVFFLSNIFSQEISPIQSFTASDYDADIQNWMITQAEDNSIIVANSSGILNYNKDWNFYPSPKNTIVRSVKSLGNKIYSGTFEDFGYWLRSSTGQYIYTSLPEVLELDVIEDEEFWDIHEISNWIVFQSLSRLIFLDRDSNEYRIISPGGDISNSFEINKSIYFHMPKQGIFTVIAGKVVPFSTNKFFRDNIVVDFFKIGSDFIVLTEDKGFYKIDENYNVFKWNTDLDSLDDVKIYSSSLSSDNLILLGTIGKGYLKLDSNGRLIQNLDKSNGLINNTILSIFEDINSNIWLALDNGLSVINEKSPFTIFNDFDGKLGTVYAYKKFRDYVYVGTNQGLFYRESKGNDDFKLIKGTSGQVWSLVEINNDLFCGHNSGTFVINKSNASLIPGTSGSWTFRKSNTNNLIFEGNYNGINVLEKKNNRWTLRNSLEGYDISARFFEVSDNNEIYVCHGLKGVYKLDLSAYLNSLKSVELLENISIEGNPSVAKFNNKIYYKNRFGIYNIDSDAKFERDSILSIAANPTGLMISDNEKLWVFSADNIYYAFNDDVTNGLKMNSVTLPNNLRQTIFDNVSNSEDESHVIGTRNGYIKMDLNKYQLKEEPFFINRVEVSSINSDPEPIEISGNSLLDYETNNIAFFFGTTNYQLFEKIEYQYRLIGYNDVWSDWSESNNISFNNLQYGNYKFELNAKVGENINPETKQISFTINRPWYLSNFMFINYIVLISLVIFLINKYSTNYYLREERRLANINKRKLEIREIQRQQQLVNLENEKLQQDVESKSRELAVSTMSMIKKNQFLGKIKTDLKKITDVSKVSSVIKTIDRNLNNEDDWRFFEEAFNNADKEFLQKIKNSHPNLTNNDLKLCAYLRLNLSSKDVAPLLNISLRSVEIKRYRLRKKMNLTHNEGLTDYILSL